MTNYLQKLWTFSKLNETIKNDDSDFLIRFLPELNIFWDALKNDDLVDFHRFITNYLERILDNASDEIIIKIEPFINIFNTSLRRVELGLNRLTDVRLSRSCMKKISIFYMKLRLPEKTFYDCETLKQILRSNMLDANVHTVFSVYREADVCEFFEIVNLISRAQNPSDLKIIADICIRSKKANKKLPEDLQFVKMPFQLETILIEADFWLQENFCFL